MYQIKNEIFCLNISETGAELEQLCIHDINILWQKSDLWKRQSPILFPIIGQVKDGYYIYENTTFFIPSHGFIKDEIFDVVQLDSDIIKLKAKYNENTLKMYPFKFEFSISYKLINNKMKIILEIKNVDTKPMYFSCGLHPGFSYEGLDQLFQEKYHIGFSQEKVKSVEFTPCLVASIKEKEIKKEMELADISLELAKYKTLCYQGLSSIELRSKTKILKIRNEMPYTAFWQANSSAPQFICIEPWYGLPDDADTNHQLINKRGILQLEKDKTFITEIEISFLDEVKK